ncbi:hypothetical protein L6164_015844 [Bauhinia variegata]|uniref:Uncharacterized protein n=1 Tax=Bauhinia variegata TaxID=167791 RepID=A0ACB9NLI6_BAUVA|nr:hypothetical protein L6164_015844 [Bauhinia variegata]
MAIPKPLLPEEHSESEKERNKISCEPLIPGLPNEIAELCLLHLPYPYQALVRSVSSSWNRVITDPTFLLSRKSLSLSLPYLFVFAFHKPTARIQWQSLDPRSGRWFVLPDMPSPKEVCPPAFACASLQRQGKLFVIGGMRSDTETSMQTTIMYRTSTNKWSIASSMPTARSFFAAKSVNGKIVAVGGSGTSAGDSIRAVEVYDPEKDTWTSAARIDTCLALYDSAVVGNKMYVTEGWTWPFIFSPRGAAYDADRDSWQEMKQGMREGWTGLSAVVGNRVLVLSEYGDCPVKVYDEEEDTWHYVGGDRFPREKMQRPFAVNAAEGRIYVVSCGLNVAIGSVVFEEDKGKQVVKVMWEVMEAPKAFGDLSPSNCQVLYA